MKIDIFAKRVALKARLSFIMRRAEAIQKEMDELEKKCEHEIVVETPKIREKDEYGLLAREYPRMYCLLCNEHLSPRKYLPKEDMDKLEKSVYIHMNDYPHLIEKWKNSYASKLENAYSNYRRIYPDLTNYEIGEKIKEELKKEDNK